MCVAYIQYNSLTPALSKSKIFLSDTYNFAQYTVHRGVIVLTIDWNLGYGNLHF